MRAAFCRLILLALISTATAVNLWSCDCIGSDHPCEAAFRADVVFSGRVLSITQDTRVDPLLSKRVRFLVENTWRGTQEREIELYTGTGRGDCGYPFEKGKRYLVYANRAIDILATGLCSRTQPLSEAGKDLAYLRTLSDPSPGARIFGRVEMLRLRPTTDSIGSTALSNIEVLLEGGGDTRKTVTDAQGGYEFRAVPPGVYHFKSPIYGVLGKEVRVPDSHACAEANLSISPPILR